MRLFKGSQKMLTLSFGNLFNLFGQASGEPVLICFIPAVMPPPSCSPNY